MKENSLKPNFSLNNTRVTFKDCNSFNQLLPEKRYLVNAIKKKLKCLNIEKINYIYEDPQISD